MAKYIGTYATSGDVQTAINNEELNRPFVAYTTSDGKVYYGADMTLAQVGDIVVYSTSDQLLHYIPQANYNTTTYPTATYVPVGVVAANQVAPLSGGASDVTYIGINWLDKNNPDSGNRDRNGMEWGDSSVDISGLTNYSSSGDAITDMTGKANTAAVLEYATGQTDWRTATAITFTNNAGMYPLFECAWRYHTSGTSQGDWYIPACGQANYLKDTDVNNALSSGFSIIGAEYYDLNHMRLSTSTEYDTSNFWFLNFGTWSNTGWSKHNKEWGCRPFCDMPMTAI